MKRLWIKNEDGLVDVFNVRKHVLDYKPEGFDEKTPLGPRYIEVMRVEDHERVVAQKDAEIERLKRERAKYEADCKRIEYFDDLHEKVATQARVIEKLKLAITDIANKNTCWRLYEIDKYKSYEDGWEGVAEFAGKVLNELAAIEKEGTKDE